MIVHDSVYKYFTVDKKRGKLEFRCKHPGCSTGYSLPDRDGPMKVGTTLSLLNHAYSNAENVEAED